jgi:hypothetical protein
VSRFPRAFEIAQGGARRPETAGFKVASERSQGGLVVRVLENPTPPNVKDDLLAHVAKDKMAVAVKSGDRELECRFVEGPGQAGPWGPATPPRRFQCPHGNVGAILMPDLGYAHRHCLYAPVPDASSRLRIQFYDVKFGQSLRFFHGLHVEGERYKKGAPIDVTFKVPVTTKERGEHEREYGRAVHKDGDGWSSAEVDTRELAGITGDLVVEIRAASPQDRLYCFAGTTR